MQHVAKLFNNGCSQAVRLPAAFRFEGAEVYITQDEDTQDVTLSRRPSDWAGFFVAAQERDPIEAFALEGNAANGAGK